MAQIDTIQRNIEEFRRVQNWMMMAEKGSPLYEAMKDRYLDLKPTLIANGITLQNLDKINED